MYNIQKCYAFFKRFLNIGDSDYQYLFEESTHTNKTDYLQNKNISFLNTSNLLFKVIKFKITNNVYHATNVKYFLDTKLFVNRHVLIPRFETEGLVIETISLIQKNNIPLNIIDIGTGSGVIAIALKKIFPQANILAIDNSQKALRIAKRNIAAHKLDIKIDCVDLTVDFKNNFNVIISNPPYIAYDGVVDDNVRKTEPANALFAKHDGLENYIQIMRNYKPSVEPYLFAFEIGQTQGEKLKKIAIDNFPDAKITVKRDLNGSDRYLFILKKMG